MGPAPATAVIRTDPAWWTANETLRVGAVGFLDLAADEIIETHRYPPELKRWLLEQAVLRESGERAYRSARARIRRGAPPPRTLCVEFIPRANLGGNGHR